MWHLERMAWTRARGQDEQGKAVQTDRATREEIHPNTVFKTRESAKSNSAPCAMSMGNEGSPSWAAARRRPPPPENMSGKTWLRPPSAARKAVRNRCCTVRAING